MALTIDDSWIRERVKLKHDHLDDVKSLSLPGTYQEKITFLGNALRGFTRLKNLDLSRNSLSSLEGLESLQLLENLNLYYNNISAMRDLSALRHLNNLKELDLRLNPVTKNEPDYRLHIVHMLPNLKRLDDRSVRDSERRAALMHFTSDQASDFSHKKGYSSNKMENDERTSIPRPEMIKNLGPRNTVYEDDDVAMLDMITRTGGDLTHPRRVTGSSSRQPDIEDFNRDEIHHMQPLGTPRQQKQDDALNKKNRSPSRIKDRVYVKFDDEVRDNPDDLLKYTDETAAYSSLNTRGHFTANPLVNGYADNVSAPRSHDQGLPPTTAQTSPGHTQESGRTYDFFSPEKRTGRGADNQGSPPTHAANQRWTSPKQSQGPLADRIRPDISPSRGYNDDAFTNGTDPVKVSDSSDKLLVKLLDLVDRYWNGSKSLHRNAKFQSMARKLLTSENSLNQHPTPGNSEKLQAELSERTVELSRLRDQMAGQHRDMDSMRSKMRTQEMMQENFDDTSKELNNVKSKLTDVSEENLILKAKTASLEAKHLGVTEQEKQLGELIKRNGILEEKAQSLNSQMTHQNKNLQQLQELTNMLQESHRSLVATNDHLLRELDETRQRHSSEVQQLHWSYDKLKNSLDWLPNGSR